MKKRISYYVSRKHVLVWLAVLALVASAVLRIAFFCGKGADAKTVWLQIVLPVVGCLSYAFILLFDGKEHFYRTAVPVFLLAIYYGIKVTMHPYGSIPGLVFVFWIAYLAVAALYLVTVSGYLRNDWLLILVLLGALCSLCYVHRVEIRRLAWKELYPVAPDILFVFAGVCSMFAAQIHLDGKYHPTWGDRSDGRRLRSLDAMQIVQGYIMPDRNDASNNLRDSVEITNMERYIRAKRKEGLASFGVTHVFLAAYVRTVAKYPALNRFFSGQKIYTRDDDIQFNMVVKTEMSTSAGESMAQLHLKPSDTSYDVYEKLKTSFEAIQGQELGSDFDKVAKALSLIPGVIFKFVIWLLKLMDYFGLIPKFLLEVSPFHASIFFTSMGSLGIPPVVHHLYNFGNLPVFVSFGCKRRVNEVLEDGTVVQKKYIDYAVNTDERIVDGFYYATALKYMKRLLLHPEQLDTPPEVVNHDVD